jgi:hypothetical protein
MSWKVWWIRKFRIRCVALKPNIDLYRCIEYTWFAHNQAKSALLHKLPSFVPLCFKQDSDEGYLYFDDITYLEGGGFHLLG